MQMSEQVKGVGELFGEAWTAYKERGVTVLGVLIVSSLVTVVCAFAVVTAATVALGGLDQVMAGMKQGQVGVESIVLICIFILLFVLLALWSQCAVLAAALDDSLGIVASMRVGWQKMWGFGWILFLVSAIVAGGFFLLVVPGIFFSVSLLFAVYFYLDNDLAGMDAVLASHYAVKGRWWSTLGKLFLLWLMAVALELIPVVGQFLYFIFLPFFLFFLISLYRNLRATALQPIPLGNRLGWSLLAALGIVLPVLGLVGAVVTVGPQLPSMLEKWRQATGVNLPQAQLPEQTRGTDPAIPNRIPAQQQRLPVHRENSLQWNDPVGDVADFGVGRWLDIERVRVRAADKTLLVDLDLHYPMTAAYNAASTTARSLHRVVVFYMDTDLKRGTGNVAGLDLVRGGYDLGVDITLEAPRNRPLEGNIHIGLFRIEDGMRVFIGPLPDQYVRIGAKNISLRIPYGLLGVHAGQKIRMSFVEIAQKQGSGLAKDKIITL